jgi:hypothetical protein
LDRNPKRELGGKGIFLFFACNPLKRLDSEKFLKTNQSYFAFIYLHWLAFICRDFSSGLYPLPSPGRATVPSSALGVPPAARLVSPVRRQARKAECFACASPAEVGSEARLGAKKARESALNSLK